MPNFRASVSTRSRFRLQIAVSAAAECRWRAGRWCISAHSLVPTTPTRIGCAIVGSLSRIGAQAEDKDGANGDEENDVLEKRSGCPPVYAWCQIEAPGWESVKVLLFGRMGPQKLLRN